MQLDHDFRPYLDESTVHAQDPLTVESLKIIAQALPFRYAEGEKEQGWQPARTVSVTVTQDRKTGRWQIDSLYFQDQFFKILFMASRGTLDGPVLLTQRGEEKQYASADAVLQDFKRIVGRRGTVDLHWYFNDDLPEGKDDESADDPRTARDHNRRDEGDHRGRKPRGSRSIRRGKPKVR
jgi:hypothetical protein